MFEERGRPYYSLRCAKKSGKHSEQKGNMKKMQSRKNKNTRLHECKVGDQIGVGRVVDACLDCEKCDADNEKCDADRQNCDADNQK